MTEEKAKSVNFTSGLLIGTIASAVVTYLYKTESGKKHKKIIDAYYREAKNHIDKLIKEVQRQNQTVSLPEAVESVMKREVKTVRRKIKTIKKNVFSKSGKPLVK